MEVFFGIRDSASLSSGLPDAAHAEQILGCELRGAQRLRA
jgi:hypothetical protein